MMRDFFYRSYLGDGEKIQFVIYRHIFMQAKDFLKIGFFGLFIPIFAWWLFPKLLIFSALWLAVGIIRFVYEFFDWYYDAWLVTNASIIEIMWEGFFKKSSARIEYHTIQGIGYEVQGLMRTIFNYGSVTLDKFAGAINVFDGAVNPKKKAEMLTRAQEAFVSNKSFRDHRTLQGLLTDLLQRHVVEHGVPETEEEAVD
ncbi:hypothetical protein HYV58_01160 [Candidatus Peregrinibacteria bacterium]|nr:hypothetical protein [Candidatus Peregrinibacteria bacterium]